MGPDGRGVVNLFGIPTGMGSCFYPMIHMNKDAGCWGFTQFPTPFSIDFDASRGITSNFLISDKLET